MKKLSRFLRVGSVMAMMLASTIVVTALPAGAVTQSQVTAQLAALQNAVQSTQAYSGITASWSSSEQSALSSEVNAIRARNRPNETSFASAINNDANNTSNALSGTLGWMNSVAYEYQLLKSEAAGGTGYLYARAVMPTATNGDNAALLAYNEAEGYFAGQNTLPSSNLGAWGLACLGIDVIATVGAFYTGGLDATAATAVAKGLALAGASCTIFGL